MSNLATMIMEGSNYGSSFAQLDRTYGHEDGAGLIAMESAEALRDIFEAEFYVPNTCTIAAALEGASCVEESTQAAIMEASVKGVFAKIKEFFIKLKAKVADFIHNIKRYLTGIFGNDVKWVTNYEKELKALNATQLKDYEINMYTYTIKKSTELGVEGNFDKLETAAKTFLNKKIREGMGSSNENWEEALDTEFTKTYEEFLKSTLGSADTDEVQKNAWSIMRNGADNKSDMDKVSVGPSEIKKYIDEIKKSTKELSEFDKIITNTNKAYDKAIKLVNDAEKYVTSISDSEDRFDSEKGMTGDNNGTGKTYATASVRANYASTLRKYSSYLSKCQGVQNTINTAAKSAYVERNAAYKKALTGAFSYAKKNKKK